MPRFEAQIWVSGEHPYQVETNAANVFAAKEILARREGVEEHEVQRVFQINEESSSSSNSDSGGGDISFGGIIALAAFIFGAWLLVTFWPLFIVGGLIWFVWWIFD
jgi:hypothetical protein